MANGAEPARVAVIGLGYWGPNLVRNFAAAEGASVTALCDLDEAALALNCGRWMRVTMPEGVLRRFMTNSSPIRQAGLNCRAPRKGANMSGISMLSIWRIALGWRRRSGSQMSDTVCATLSRFIVKPHFPRRVSAPPRRFAKTPRRGFFHCPCFPK